MPLITTRLLLIRHGQSPANADGRLQGHLDFPLSERGRQESGRLADRLSRLSIDALYTSPLLRARETAVLIAKRIGLEPEERSALMERDVGEIAGLTREEIWQSYPGYVQARREGVPVPIQGFEGDDAFRERVLSELDAIAGAHRDQTVAVVTHGGVIFAFCREALGLPVIRPGPFAVSNTSLSIFHVNDGEFDPRVTPRIQLIALNDTCHVEGLT